MQQVTHHKNVADCIGGMLRKDIVVRVPEYIYNKMELVAYKNNLINGNTMGLILEIK